MTFYLVSSAVSRAILKPVYQFGIPNSDPSSLESVKFNSSKNWQMAVHALVSQCALSVLFCFHRESSFLYILVYIIIVGWRGGRGGVGGGNIFKWEVMLLYCATRTHSTPSFDVLLFDGKKSIVICLSESRNYLWIYSVTMGRPKTTRKSRNCNASTYTSKSVFKNKKTILRRLRSAFCVEIDSQAVN